MDKCMELVEGFTFVHYGEWSFLSDINVPFKIFLIN